MRLRNAIGRPTVLALAVSLLACKGGDGKEEKTGAGESAKDQMASVLVKEYAGLAFPLWAREHVDVKCPSDIGELAALTRSKPVDPWGNELVMLCGDKAPAEAKGFGVISMGGDGKLDTADDIRSWESGP